MNWIKQLFSRRNLYDSLSEEIQEHLDEKIEELVASGMPRKEAAAAARRVFGNVTLIENDSRQVWRWPSIEDFLMDVRFGGRMLRKNPGFTAVAIVTLALAVAANSTVFSSVSAFILRPPNIKNPDRVAVILTVDPAKQGWGWYRNPVSVPDFIAWRAQSNSFEDMAASEESDFTITGSGEPELLSGRLVSANYFDVLGVTAALGRTFVSGEDQPGQQQVAVLSHALWQRRFGSNPKLIGETVSLNGERFTVIGVMPSSFALSIYRPQLWTPLVFSPERLLPEARESRSLAVLARLKPGVNVEAAKAEMATLAQRSDETNPGTTKGWSASAMTLQRFNADEFKVGVPPMVGAVIFVLLICCANIASLQLARATERQRELAVRTALGAGRFRLVRQLLVESLLLAFTGGALGLLLAYWGVALLRGGINETETDYSAAVRVDQNVLLYTVGMSIFAAIVFGLAPALHQTGLDRHSPLKLGTRTGSHTKHSSRIHSVLVCVQIALALALVTGAEIYVQEFVRAISGAFGIDPNQVLTANISLSSKRYTAPSTQAAFFHNVIQRLSAVPGVAYASATTTLVPNAEDDHREVTFSIAGQPTLLRAKRERTEYYAISPDYLSAVRIPLLRGRSFSESDTAQAAPVVLVNQTLVRRYFPKDDPLGIHLRLDTDPSDRADWPEIVGVVADTTSHNRNQMPQVYEPYVQRPAPLMTFAIRTSSDPAAFAPALRQAVWAVDKGQPVVMVQTMNQIIANYERNMFSVIEMMGFLAGFGLVLAMMGVFGVIAYAVARRTQEIGIRMAIGAQGGDVVRMVVKKGLVLSVIGVATGLVLGIPVLWLRLSGDEAEVIPFNQRISIFLMGALLIGFAALLASYIPARGATRVDPIVALRHE